MDAAKAAINKLTSQHGQHETTVHEHYKPAVTHETIAPTREHRETTVVDNEVHQDHYHTTVLPVKDQQVLPTEHKHELGAQKHAEFKHGDHEGIKSRVAAEASQFQHRTETQATEKTHTVAPTVAGEHHHHHVHETIQPVIQKQTIQPSVVHTTIPVHEVHHNEPKHYTASALPAVSMADFKQQGGALSGLADRVERFEGEPENIAARGAHGQTGHHGHHGDKTALLDGSSAGTGVAHERSGVLGSSTTGTGLTGSHHNTHDTTGHTSGLTGSNTTGTGLAGKMGTTDSTHHDTTSGLGHSGSRTSHDSGKPSLIDRINPFKDSDKDGKKGLMD